MSRIVVKRRTIAFVLIALLLIVTGIVWFLSSRQATYGVDAQGVLHAPLRTQLHATRTSIDERNGTVMYRTTYQSYGATIVGNLYIPKGAGGEAMLLLPGGGVTKEGESATALAFARRGFIVLTLDQRGVGETGGAFNSLDEDYAAFENGQIPTVHLLILDALGAIQYLREQPETKGKILLSGESMGGRAAAVAGGMSTDITGLLLISTAGFGDPSLPAEQKRFLNSFDPDANIGDVTVPIIFLHSTNDTTIPIAYANGTFQRARAPKEFLTVDHCQHGYCAAMEPLLDESLRWMESLDAD